MSWVGGALATTLGVVFVWGVIAPRSQWHALSSWLVANPGAQEPGGAAYGWRRFLSAMGVLGLLVVAGSAYSADVARQPKPALPESAVQRMWGSPAPLLVDRIITSADEAPTGLVEVPLLGFQNLDGDRPAYLRALTAFSVLGDRNLPGYVGTVAGSDVSATGAANLVVNVRGPLLCIPRQVVIIESETAVQIAVYYGLPDPLTGSPPDHIAGCPLDAAVTNSVLVPIELAAPIGDRVVESLAGGRIPEINIVE